MTHVMEYSEGSEAVREEASLLLVREREENILFKERYSFRRAGYRGGNEGSLGKKKMRGKIFFWA